MYTLKCPCGLEYVDQTQRHLKLRIAVHKKAIRNRDVHYAIARHYINKRQGSDSTLRYGTVSPDPRRGDIIKQLLTGIT